MDPRKQECHGEYLYGAGYFSRDDNSLLLVNRPEHFCRQCPRMTSCEQELDRRVRDAVPADVERFERILAEAQQRGYAPALARMLLGRKGLDPFARAAVMNFNRGHAERGSQAGFLVHSDVDPRHR